MHEDSTEQQMKAADQGKGLASILMGRLPGHAGATPAWPWRSFRDHLCLSCVSESVGVQVPIERLSLILGQMGRSGSESA
jgi:hypothetical protein